MRSRRVLLLALALTACRDSARSEPAATPTPTADLSSIGSGPEAAVQALLVCFGEAGMDPVRLEGRSELARTAGAGVAGAISATVGNSPVNIFEVATTAAEARRIRALARRRGLEAGAVERVFYSSDDDWVPSARRLVDDCLKRVAAAT